MADGFEQAEITFGRDMGGEARSSSPSDISERKVAPEPIFGNSDSHENDLVAGGDNEPYPKSERKAKKAKEDDEEDEFALDGDPEDADDGSDPEDADDDSDPEDADDEDSDEKEFLNQKVTVNIDGEPQEVDLREALNGYIRTQTWHRRMNEVDSARKEVVAHAERVVEDRQRADILLSEAEQLMAEFIPQEPDWDKLFAEDPANARRLQKNYEKLHEKLAEIRNKRSAASKEQAEKDVQDTIRYSKEEFQKFANTAKWRNKEEMEKDISSMRRTALSTGFTEEELRNVHDSRMLNILRKASKYDRMMATKPKPAAPSKMPVTPGAGSKSTAHKGLTGAQKKLASTGSIEDAAAVFGQIIKRR